MNKNQFKIAILLPTRGRAAALTDSINSLLVHAKNTKDIQFIFGFDNDDNIGFDHFVKEIQPDLDSRGIEYIAMGFESMGYAGLNQYYNVLAEQAQADWLFVWNDDAIMETQNWDQVIAKHTGTFKVLKLHTHNEHPYSIFPIVPSSWVSLLGHLSLHQMVDAEISQIAYMLDIMEIIEIDATHNQSELTGEGDNTSKNKIRFEGNPLDPRDFHNQQRIQRRIDDTDKLAKHMLSIGMSIDWWQKVKMNQQDAWAKLRANDINKQMVRTSIVNARQFRCDPIIDTTKIVKDNV
jgi:hypothetical protein